MMRHHNPIRPLLYTLVLSLSLQLPSVQGISRCSQNSVAAASIPHSPRYYRQQRSSRLLASSRNFGYGSSYSRKQILLAARTKKQKASKKKAKQQQQESLEEQDGDPFARPMTNEEIYASLGPIATCVAGTVEIAVSTVMEYITGFLGGYFIGYLTDLPRFVFKSANKEQPLPFLQELSQRYGRMHGKSYRWARTWGGISAAFGGFRVATRVVRGGKEDEWNTIISTAAAGAFFARKEGPQAMLRGALTYGGMMYLFSGGFGAKKEPFEYSDQPIDDF